MAGQDASRFDYLFESDDVDHDATADPVPDVTDPPRRSWSSIAVVMAVVVGAGLGAVILWPRTADAGRTPAAVTTTVPQAPVLTSTPVVAPPPEPLPEPVTTAAQPPPPPVPVPVVEAPSTSAAPPPKRMPAPTPTLRVPMSVSPTPRPAFPNQHPDPGSDGHGGLLGTGLL